MSNEDLEAVALWMAQERRRPVTIGPCAGDEGCDAPPEIATFLPRSLDSGVSEPEDAKTDEASVANSSGPRSVQWAPGLGPSRSNLSSQCEVDEEQGTHSGQSKQSFGSRQQVSNPPSVIGQQSLDANFRAVPSGASGLADATTSSHGVMFYASEAPMLRGTPLNLVLRGGAAVLSDRDGSRADHDLSDTTSEIDTFISYNRAVPRLIKFLALCLHFNLNRAAAVAAAVAFVSFVLQAAEIIPLVHKSYPEHILGVPEVGIFSQLIVTPIFLLVLLSWHEFARCLKCRGPVVFLDTTCIAQYDPIKKSLGASKLGAFIRYSTRIVIIYSDLYLRKLWTVAEVTFFLQSAGSDCVGVVHTSTVRLFFALLTMMCSALVVFWLPSLDVLYHGYPLAAYLYSIMWAVAALLYAVICRKHHRAFAATWARLDTFSICNAICADETDRPILLDNIEKFVKHFGYVDTASDSVRAREVFNCLVREHALQTLQIHLGTSPVPYKYLVVAVSLTHGAEVLDNVAGLIVEFGVSSARPWTLLICILTAIFIHLPLACRGIEWMTLQFLVLSGLLQWVWVIFSAVIIFAITLVGSFGAMCLLLDALWHSPNGTMQIYSVVYAFASWQVLAYCAWRIHKQGKTEREEEAERRQHLKMSTSIRYSHGGRGSAKQYSLPASFGGASARQKSGTAQQDRTRQEDAVKF